MRTATLSLAAAALAFCVVSVRAEPLADAAIPAQNNDHSTSSSNSYGISDWQTCHPGKDSCSNSNSKCCIAKDDKYSGKYTCRPHGKDCDDYSYSSSYGDSSYGSDYNDNYSNDYYNDNSNDYSDGYSDDYSSNYYGARAKGGRARPSAGRPQSPAHRGLMHSKAYSDDYYGVSDWKTCHPSSDKCSNPSSKCCVAKDDKHSGKYTCRPAGKDCDGYSYGSSYGSDYSSDYNDYSGSNDYSDYNDYNDYSGSNDYNDYSYSSDYYGARARHSGARARPHARPQGNNHVDVCEVTYKTYVGNCNAAYAQTHKKEEHEKCLDGAKAWKEICEAQSGYY